MKKNEQRHERLLRLKKKIERRLRKLRIKDPHTAGEINWRDKKLYGLSTFFRSHGITANLITYAGFIVSLGVHLMMWYPYHPALIFLLGLFGFFTDLIDGSVARWKDPITGKDTVTGWGTFLDHTRDAYLASLFGWHAIFGVGATRAIQVFLGLGTALCYAFIGFGAGMRYQASTLLPPSSTRKENFAEFCLLHMQTTFWGRVQFGLAASAAISLFLGKTFESYFLIELSYPLFGGSILMGFRNLIETDWDYDE